MIDHDLSVLVGPAAGCSHTIAPSGAPKNMLVFKANHESTDRFQGSRVRNEIALKSHRLCLFSKRITKARTDSRAPDSATKSL